MTDIWRDLAAMMGPDGKPLIPGLTRRGADEDGAMQTYIVGGPEAILVAQEYILSRGQFWGFEVDHGIYGITMLIWDGGKLVSESDPQPIYAAALAQALWRALKEKP